MCTFLNEHFLRVQFHLNPSICDLYTCFRTPTEPKRLAPKVYVVNSFHKDGDSPRVYVVNSFHKDGDWNQSR